ANFFAVYQKLIEKITLLHAHHLRAAAQHVLLPHTAPQAFEPTPAPAVDHLGGNASMSSFDNSNFSLESRTSWKNTIFPKEIIAEIPNFQKTQISEVDKVPNSKALF